MLCRRNCSALASPYVQCVPRRTDHWKLNWINWFIRLFPSSAKRTFLWYDFYKIIKHVTYLNQMLKKTADAHKQTLQTLLKDVKHCHNHLGQLSKCLPIGTSEFLTFDSSCWLLLTLISSQWAHHKNSFTKLNVSAWHSQFIRYNFQHGQFSLGHPVHMYINRVIYAVTYKKQNNVVTHQCHISLPIWKV